MSILEIQQNGYGICKGTTFDSNKNLVTKEYLTSKNSNSNLVGEIKMYTGKSIPDKWQFCNGTSLSKTIFKSLFDVIGTTYGQDPNNTNNFLLPNFKSRVPICSQQSEYIYISYQNNNTYSSGNKNMNFNQLPSHYHTIGGHTHNCTNQQKTYSWDTDRDYKVSTASGSQNQPEAKNIKASISRTTDTPNGTLNTGDFGETKDFLPPFCVVNFIIYTGVSYRT